ncbi:MAG: hypothetical protein Q4C13_00940 [Clostridia bacterium]|nr:hypothetical protein [Clostridia bacterium]
MSFRRWCGDMKRRWCRCGFKPVLGVCCILLALLILLICAPSWLVAVIISMLLLALGFWLL